MPQTESVTARKAILMDLEEKVCNPEWMATQDPYIESLINVKLNEHTSDELSSYVEQDLNGYYGSECSELELDGKIERLMRIVNGQKKNRYDNCNENLSILLKKQFDGKVLLAKLNQLKSVPA